MQKFVSEVNNFFLKEKGIGIADIDYNMEMPQEKEKYNLFGVIGNGNLTAGRYKIKPEADRIVTNFLSMSLP